MIPEPDISIPDDDDPSNRRLGPVGMLIILILLCSLLLPLFMPLLGEIQSNLPPPPTTVPLRTTAL